MYRRRRCMKRPKGRRSAYAYFVQDYRKRLTKKMGMCSFVEISRMCAAKWKHMCDEDKEKFRKMSEADALRYKREIQAIPPKELRLMKRRRDPCAPVKPLSAYLWFCKCKWKKFAACHPNKPLPEIIKGLAKLWGCTDKRVRERYEVMAEYDKKCYEAELERYRAKKCGRNKK